ISENSSACGSAPSSSAKCMTVRSPRVFSALTEVVLPSKSAEVSISESARVTTPATASPSANELEYPASIFISRPWSTAVVTDSGFPTPKSICPGYCWQHGGTCTGDFVGHVEAVLFKNTVFDTVGHANAWRDAQNADGHFA